METIENNKLIAEFMGLYFNTNKKAYINTYDSPSYLKHNREEGDLQYNSSWDWLMPVKEHINIIDENHDLIKEIQMWINSVNIKEAYKSIVVFIKWYNEQQK